MCRPNKRNRVVPGGIVSFGYALLLFGFHVFEIVVKWKGLQIELEQEDD